MHEMDRVLPPSAEAKDHHGGSAASQIRRRKPSSRVRRTTEESLGFMTTVSNNSENYKGEGVTGKFDLLASLHGTSAKATTGEDDANTWCKHKALSQIWGRKSPPSLVRAFVYLMLVSHVSFPLLRWHFLDSRMLFVSLVSISMYPFMLTSIIAFLSDSIPLEPVIASTIPAFLLISIYMRPFTVVLTQYQVSILCAVACGYVLAQHRQHIGAEKSAKIALLHSRSVQSKTSDVVPAGFMLCLVGLVFVVRMISISVFYTPEDPIGAVMEMSFLIIGYMFVSTCFVNGILLCSALFSGQVIGMLYVTGLMFLYVLLFTLAILFGEAVSIIIPWLGAIAAAGLFGYSNCVFRNYKVLKRNSLHC